MGGSKLLNVKFVVIRIMREDTSKCGCNSSKI